jgi:hypothetical protein
MLISICETNLCSGNYQAGKNKVYDVVNIIIQNNPVKHYITSFDFMGFICIKKFHFAGFMNLKCSSDNFIEVILSEVTCEYKDTKGEALT